MLTRRKFLAHSAVIASSLALAPSLLGNINRKKPNVIVIIADDLGYADLSFLKHAPSDVNKHTTPGLEALARTGTYFSNAYATSPICSPARLGLLTGRHQARWGGYWYGDGGLPVEELTIPEQLVLSGYSTYKLGKTHLNGGEKEFPNRHGFEKFLGFIHHTWDYTRLSQKDVDAYKKRDKFTGFDCQILGPLVKAEGLGKKQSEAEPVSYDDGFTTDIFTDEACKYIKDKRKTDKPFYLHISYNAVHMPTYVTDKKWADMVKARYVPWDRDADKWGYPYWEPNEETAREFHYGKWGHMGQVDPEGRRCYLSQLLALDDGIKRIINTLEKTDQRENTLLIFVSDNGGTINTYSNNTPLRGYKYMLGEGGIRIPMIVSMPGTLPEGKTNNEALVSTMDIFPTIMDVIGENSPSNLDGKSLLPVLKGNINNRHDWLVWAKNQNTWVLRKGKWKVTNNAQWSHNNYTINDKGDCVAAEEQVTYPGGTQLFDLENDIGETTNLADKHPEIVKDLQETYKTWKSQMEPPINGWQRMKKTRGFSTKGNKK